MLLGMAVGAAFATVMFAITSSPLWYGAIGVRVAQGLGIGAASTKTIGPRDE